MVSTSDFRTGLIMRLDGELWTVVEFQHVKVARGGAFVRTKLKNVQTGRVQEKTFRSGEKVQDVRVERRQMQYLYREGDSLVVMDNESYEQLNLAVGMLGDGINFLKESEMLDVLMDGDNPIGVEMPITVELEITETDPGFKGDTVTGATKKAVLETGGEVQVPMFIEQGEKIKVDTRTGAYMERVK